jgi:hypothetical protein
VYAIKSRKGHRIGKDEIRGRLREQQRGRQLSKIKILEIAFWGTIIWGIIRMSAHFLNLTPYGLGSYARPLMGLAADNSWVGIGAGMIVLFLETLAASALFSIIFRRSRIWWSGLIYGVLMLAIAGFFFRIMNWNMTTLSTEGAWFLSFGLFVGMSLTLEQSDEEL